MSKYRKDLIPVKVYFRDGSCYEIKIGALANCKDTLYELIRTLRQSPKLKASDHLLKYFTICSVTGPSGLERIVPYHENIWGTIQQFATNDRLEFCRFLHPPLYTIPIKRTSTSSISTLRGQSQLMSSSSDPENNSKSNGRAYVSDSEAMSKKRIHIPSDNEKEKDNSPKKTKQGVLTTRTDRTAEWAEFTENCHLFLECPIHKVSMEEVAKLSALYIYSIMKQKNLKTPSKAVDKYFGYAFPKRFMNMATGQVRARVLEHCIAFMSQGMKVDETLREFNDLFKAWKYYGLKVFYDCKIEDKKLNLNAKTCLVGIHEDGIVILKKDGEEIFTTYPFSSIVDFGWNGHSFLFDILGDVDRVTEYQYTVTVTSVQCDSIAYTLEAYLDRYVSTIFSFKDSLKKVKGPHPMVKITTAYSRKQPLEDDVSNGAIKEDKKKKRKFKRRTRSGSVSSKNSDVESGVKSSDDSFGSKKGY